jgi:hypothetical protein
MHFFPGKVLQSENLSQFTQPESDWLAKNTNRSLIFVKEVRHRYVDMRVGIGNLYILKSYW